jgi:hypothetical protein
MKNYVYIYRAKKTKPSSPDVIETWNAWFVTLGDNVVDGGKPIVGTKKVLRQGKVETEQDDIIGYSIVKAASLEEAVEMAKTNPLASAPGCAVGVYETGQM